MGSRPAGSSRSWARSTVKVSAGYRFWFPIGGSTWMLPDLISTLAMSTRSASLATST